MHKTRIAAAAMAVLLCGAVLAQEPTKMLLDQVPVKRAPGTSIRIELVGDSTTTTSHGWAAGFCANLTAQVDCVTMGKGGASSRTYRADGYWKLALATRPDYMLIQLGGNDVHMGGNKSRESEPAEFAENMRGYLKDALAAGIKPVIVTMVSRRRYGADGKIDSPYPPYLAVEEAVAKDMGVPVIDLHADSMAALNAVGPAGQQMYGRVLGLKSDGSPIADNAHMNSEGSYLFGRMAAVDMGKAVPALAQYVKPTPAPLPSPGWPVPRNAPEKGEKD